MEQEYFKTDQKLLTELNENSISELYAKGYVFTRVKRGLFNQTRSLRIDLSKFELSSENRRILKKNEDLILKLVPLPYPEYSWGIHKMGKEFYTVKFGDGTMSASKIKELFLETDKSNVNSCFTYSVEGQSEGYCLAYTNNELVHYSYPFYNLEIPKENSLGLAMMIKAVEWAKINSKKYVYLGSVTDSKSKYKLQFSGLEWFDTDKQEWNPNLENLKQLIS